MRMYTSRGMIYLIDRKGVWWFWVDKRTGWKVSMDAKEDGVDHAGWKSDLKLIGNNVILK